MEDQIRLLRQKAKEEEERLKKMSPEERERYLDEQKKLQKDKNRRKKMTEKERKEHEESNKGQNSACKERAFLEDLELKKRSEEEALWSVSVQDMVRLHKELSNQVMIELKRKEVLEKEKQVLDAEKEKMSRMTPEEREAYTRKVRELMAVEEMKIQNTIKERQLQEQMREEALNQMRQKKMELEKLRLERKHRLEQLGSELGVDVTEEDPDLEEQMNSFETEDILLYGNAKNVRKYAVPDKLT